MRTVFVVLALAASLAHADTLTVTWVQPTQREDGSPLLASEIANYRMVWTVAGVVQADKTVPTGTSYVLDTGALSGKICLRLATVDTDGVESVLTSEVCRKARPKSATGLAVK